MLLLVSGRALGATRGATRGFCSAIAFVVSGGRAVEALLAPSASRRRREAFEQEHMCRQRRRQVVRDPVLAVSHGNAPITSYQLDLAIDYHTADPQKKILSRGDHREAIWTRDRDASFFAPENTKTIVMRTAFLNQDVRRNGTVVHLKKIRADEGQSSVLLCAGVCMCVCVFFFLCSLPYFADPSVPWKVEELCEMLDDYQISKDRDLPKNVWDFMREKGFLGMVIPQEYGERLACLPACLTLSDFVGPCLRTHHPVCFVNFSDV